MALDIAIEAIEQTEAVVGPGTRYGPSGEHRVAMALDPGGKKW